MTYLSIWTRTDVPAIREFFETSQSHIFEAECCRMVQVCWH